MGGRPCVVSTFRLGQKKVPANKFKRRLIDVANHELGHTLGLDHCPHIGCLMEDAKGTIKVVDRSTGKFCGNCRKMVTIILGSM
jgi:archaemetzincin